MNTEFRQIFEREYTWTAGFMRNVRRFGGREAMIYPDTDRRWTYDELNRESNKFAAAMLRDGLKKGDVIMYQLLNCPEFVFVYVACHKLHTVNAPVSYRLSPGEIAQNIDDSKPRILLFDSQREKEILEAVSLATFKPERLIVTDSTSHDNILSYNDYVGSMSTEDPVLPYELNIYDETTRLYTSGTTGRQKGVPLTSVNEVLSSHDVMIHFPMNYRDISMNTTPWFHRGGLHCAGPCPTLYAGGCMVIMSKFNAEKTLDYIGKYHITFVIGVPTVLEDLADAQEDRPRDLSSLRGIVTMGSPLEKASCIRYQKTLTHNIFNGYGTTETFWNPFLRPFDLPEYAGSAGASCIDDDVRVVKVYEDRKAEPWETVAMDGNEVGEVIINTPAKSPYCYYNNPEATASKYYKDFIYTNDLATWDKKQFITIVGRKDDMIISSGENIYPTQVEEVLNMNAKVKDCIVTAVPDRVRGQLVTAYVIKSDDSLTVEELDQFCKDSPYIANFKRPRYYRFVEEIPLNATGKKLHYKIKQTAAKDLEAGLLTKI